MLDTYEPSKAEAYWSDRLKQTNQMAAVLSFSLPDYLNRAYSEWEIETVVKSLPELTGLRLLDVGCGVGRVTVPMAQRGALVTAFDNSAEMLATCRANARNAGVDAHVQFEKGSADALPFGDGTFDVVLCLGVLEHLPPMVRQKALQHLIRVVRPGGTLALVVNNEESRFLSEESRYGMSSQQDNGYFVGIIGKKNIKSFFAQHGFVVRTEGSNFFQSLIKHVGRKMNILGESKLLPTLTELALRLDLDFPKKGDLDAAYADQWVISARSVAHSGKI